MLPFSCDICEKNFNGEKPFNDHLASEKHKNKEKALKISLKNPSEWHQDPFVKCVGFCSICKMTFVNLDQVKSHVRGGTHAGVIGSSIRFPKIEELPQISNQSNANLSSISTNIPDPRIEINENIDEVEKLFENIKVLISKL